MKVFLGIDPGTSLGFSFIGLDDKNQLQLLAAGTWRLDSSDGKKKGSSKAKALGERMSSLWTLLDGALQEILSRGCSLEAVSYESLKGGWAFKSTSAAILHGAQAGIISLWAVSRKIPLYGATPAEIKTAATGKGNAKKEQVLFEAQRRFKSAAWFPGTIKETHESEATWAAVISAIEEIQK